MFLPVALQKGNNNSSIQKNQELLRRMTELERDLFN